MKGIIGDGEVQTKAITFKVPGDGTSYPMLLTAFDGEGHDTFDRSGYRGRYVVFTFIDGMVQECVVNHHDIEHPVIGKEAKEFVHQVFQGWRTEGMSGIPWGELEDEGVYTKEDFEEFMD